MREIFSILKAANNKLNEVMRGPNTWAASGVYESHLRNAKKYRETANALQERFGNDRGLYKRATDSLRNAEKVRAEMLEKGLPDPAIPKETTKTPKAQ